MIRISESQKKLGIALVFMFGFVGVAAGITFFPSASNQGYMPTQPIPFSHKRHSGQNKIACMYCHSSADQSKHASIPAVSVCMNCHTVVKTESPLIQKVTEHFTSGKPIEWVRIHELPDYVYFPHKKHVGAGVSCQTCHGPVEEMDKVYQYSALTMGWCMSCHRGDTTPKDILRKKFGDEKLPSGHLPVAPVNCNTCHY